MDILKNLISQLEATTSDPVIKLFVICITILAAITIISIIFKIIKGIFMKIFKLPRRNNRPAPQTPKANIPKEAKGQPDNTTGAQPDPTERMAPTDTHLQDAQELLNIIKKTIQAFPNAVLTIDIPAPISLKEAHPLIQPELLTSTEYQITADDTETIIKLLENKNIVELEQLLKSTQNNLKTLTITAEADKKQCFNLFTQRKALEAAEESAVLAYNEELLSAETVVETSQQKLKELIQGLTSAEQNLAKLITAENDAVNALQLARQQLKDKTVDIKNYINTLNSTKIDKDSEIEKLNSSINMHHQTAEKSIGDLKQNDISITALLDKINHHNKELAVGQLTVQILNDKIKELKAKAAEAARLAEQKAREEAEAKAKAEEARRLEERRKLEEAKRLEEENRQKEEQARLEAKRIAEEKAEKERLEQERLALEAKQKQEQEEQARLLAEKELKNNQTEPASSPTPNVSQQDVSRETSETEQNRALTPPPTNETLTAAEQAAQAKAIMEAQRKRRAEAAKLKRQQNQESGPINETGQQAPAATDSSSSPVTAQEVKTQQEPLPQTKIEPPPAEPEPELNEKIVPDTDEIAEDPMAAIRADWERERVIQDALKAGNVDEALNLVSKKQS